MDEFSETREAETHWSQPLRGDTEIQYMGNCPKFTVCQPPATLTCSFHLPKKKNVKVTRVKIDGFLPSTKMVPGNGAFTKSAQKLMGCFFCVHQAVVQ